MRRNRLRELLRAGQPTIGTHLHLSSPTVVEVVGHTGLFDYVEFVAEYAPFHLYALEDFCRAAELYDLSAMIKVDQEPQRFLAQRAIGAGFESVLFADSRSVDDARACVRAVRPDTPESGGLHGVGWRRATYMFDAGSPEYVRALNDVVVALMIEKRTAVEQLDEILSLEGVDMVQFGPADYSMSIGKPGAAGSSEVKAVERRVIEACLAKGVAPRAEIDSADQARHYLDLGVRHFSIGTDVAILYQWMKTAGEDLRKAISNA